jgi:hypothetical protein
MNTIYTTLFLASCLVISGCKSTDEATKTSESNDKYSANQKSQPLVNSAYPKWIFSPTLTGFYVVLGSAPKQINNNYRAQLIVAIASARSELAKIKNTSVSSTLDMERTSESPLAFESNTSIKSDVVFDISKADVLKSWKHPETEELFILYGYKTK